MGFEQFQNSLKENQPPSDLPLVLAALWWDGKGDWAKAHECAQQRETPEHAWVHAYLHRKEGDLGNAGYWYRKAGKPVGKGPLDEERRQLVCAVLGDK